MAIISSHTLNSVDGTHAGGIDVTLFRFDPSGARSAIFKTKTDDGGRLSETIAVSEVEKASRYELVFQTGAYFSAQRIPVAGMQIMPEIVIRFAIPDPDARYHIPLMLAPNSYSVWWSS